MTHAPISPMLCGWQAAPFGNEPLVAKPDTAYEIKWDGYRMVGIKQGETVILTRRGGVTSVNEEYPEVVAAMRALPVDCILDGEALVLRDGWPSFQDHQNRMSLSAERRAADLKFMVFDVLSFGELDITSRPYRERRAVLEKLVTNDGGTLMVGPSSTDAAKMWSFVLEHKLEGLIAKPLNSPYLPGDRGRGTWIKIKRIIVEAFTVVGYVPGGRKEGFFGALIVAEPDGEGLRICGSVGTGFSDVVTIDLLSRMAPLRRDTPAEALVEKPVIKGVVWVEPSLQGMVAYAERTDGNGLRGPASWQGVVE